MLGAKSTSKSGSKENNVKAGRVWGVIRWWLIVLVALAVVFFLVVVPWFFTYVLTARKYHFRDPNDGKTPQDFGMPYQAADFRAKDGVDIKGWYLPATSETAGAPLQGRSGSAAGTIIYCHGVNRTRIEMLPMALFGHSLGYDGLLFDFRHEGASGGAISTIGYQERLDVEGAVRYALDQQHASQPVILWGVSMGAAAALMAAAETSDVAAVISDSSFLSFADTVRHHWRLYVGGPAFPITNEVIAWVGWRGHFRPSNFDLRRAVERINPRPILFVAVEDDKRMPPEIARTLYGLATSPDRMLVVVPGNRHGEGFRSGHEQYEQAVKEFLAKVNSGSGTGGDSPDQTAAASAGVFSSTTRR